MVSEALQTTGSKVIFLAANNEWPIITLCPAQPPSLMEFPKALSWTLSSFFSTSTIFLFVPKLPVSSYSLIILILASFMYQFHHQLLPPDLLGDDFFNVDTLSHSYDTRHAHEPFISLQHLTLSLPAIPPNLRAYMTTLVSTICINSP